MSVEMRAPASPVQVGQNDLNGSQAVVAIKNAFGTKKIVVLFENERVLKPEATTGH